MATASFTKNAATQSWIVPAGVNQILIQCAGAQGGGSGGKGGYVTGYLQTTPGEILYIGVGGQDGTQGGGGGGGGSVGGGGASGGGMSWLSSSSSFGTGSVLIVGAGGGGGASNGYGGGTTGADGTPQPGDFRSGDGGHGGTQSAGGGGGTGRASGGSGVSGSAGTGGAGGAGYTAGGTAHGGGGGGAGYYGGGGGGGSGYNSGDGSAGTGAGGSSYLSGSISSGTDTGNSRSGDGFLTIIYSATPTFSPTAGTAYSDINVALSSSTGGTIYYTTDGSTPTHASSTYSTPLHIGSTAVLVSETIKALALSGDGADSTVGTAAYTVNSVANPANAYALDGSLATMPSASAVLNVYISKDGGSTWSTPIASTFTSSLALNTYGNGATELWGTTFTSADITNANLQLKVQNNGNGTFQIYKNFGFSITSSYILTGLEIAIDAKYTSGDSAIYIDLIEAKIHYGTSVIPIVAGSQAYASNGRKTGETAGNGTGVLVFYDNAGNWCSVINGLTITA